MPIRGPVNGTHGSAQVLGESMFTSGTVTDSRPWLSGSALSNTVPRYLP